MNDFNLSGQALKTATVADAREMNCKCEAAKFESAKAIGYSWKPTRQLLYDHIVRDIDLKADVKNLRRAAFLLGTLQILELAAICALFFR